MRITIEMSLYPLQGAPIEKILAFIEWEEPHWIANSIGAYGSSLWYRWTPPADGWFTFDLSSAAFDSLLGISTGDRLDRLTWIAGNDNYGTRTTSRFSFYALAGTRYSVVVAGKDELDSAAAGSFRLQWHPTPPPAARVSG